MLIFHVLIKKSVVYIIRDLGLVGYTPIYISLHLGKSVFLLITREQMDEFRISMDQHNNIHNIPLQDS